MTAVRSALQIPCDKFTSSPLFPVSRLEWEQPMGGIRRHRWQHFLREDNPGKHAVSFKDYSANTYYLPP